MFDGLLMTLLRELRRLGACVLAPVALSAALLSACGGGTSQVEPFKPLRLIALGDENSVIVNDGSNDGFRYTLNNRRGTAVGKCLNLPIFTQSMASYYGMAFAACNPTAATPTAFVYAVVGARIDDPVSGLAAQIAGVAGLGATDMVSVMIGGNDVIALYEQVRDGSLSRAAALVEAGARGRRAASMVTGLLTTGARAIVVTAPDLQSSPYAKAQGLVFAGAAALLSELGYALNGSLRTNVEPNDGRHWGLVLADDIVAAMAKVPTAFLASPSAVGIAACTTASAKDCVLTDDVLTTTLVTGAGTNTHLWADDRHLGPDAHSRIGQQVLARAVNNPF